MTVEHAHGIDTGGEVEAVLALMDGSIHRESNYVRDWPKDERDLYRDGDWRSFEERDRALSRLRAQKIVAATRASAADAVLAEARQLCCGENPSTHHEATAKHSERMAFAGDLARAVRGL